MDQADIADQVITDLSLKELLLRPEASGSIQQDFRFPRCIALIVERRYQKKEKQPFKVASVVSAVEKITNCKAEGVSK